MGCIGSQQSSLFPSRAYSKALSLVAAPSGPKCRQSVHARIANSTNHAPTTPIRPLAALLFEIGAFLRFAEHVSFLPFASAVTWRFHCVYGFYDIVAPLVTPPSPIELIPGGSIEGRIGLVGPISQLLPPSPPTAGMDVPKFFLLRHTAKLPMELTDGFSPLLGQSHKGHVPHIGHGPVDPLRPQNRVLMTGTFSTRHHPCLTAGDARICGVTRKVARLRVATPIVQIGLVAKARGMQPMVKGRAEALLRLTEEPDDVVVQYAVPIHGLVADRFAPNDVAVAVHLRGVPRREGLLVQVVKQKVLGPWQRLRSADVVGDGQVDVASPGAGEGPQGGREGRPGLGYVQPFESVREGRCVRVRCVVGEIGHGRFVEAGAYVPVAVVVFVFALVIVFVSVRVVLALILKRRRRGRSMTTQITNIGTSAKMIMMMMFGKVIPQHRRKKEGPKRHKGREGRDDNDDDGRRGL